MFWEWVSGREGTYGLVYLVSLLLTELGEIFLAHGSPWPRRILLLRELLRGLLLRRLLLLRLLERCAGLASMGLAAQPAIGAAVRELGGSAALGEGSARVALRCRVHCDELPSQSSWAVVRRGGTRAGQARIGTRAVAGLRFV